MKNSKKNIFKVIYLTIFFVLVVMGFSVKHIHYSKNSSSGNNMVSNMEMNQNIRAGNFIDGQLQIYVPPTGFLNTNLTIIVSGDSSFYLSNCTVTISKASGPGNMNGSHVLYNVNGYANFNDISFDALGIYTVTATANGQSVTSTPIQIYPTPVPSKLVIKNITACDTSSTIMVNSSFNVTVQAQDENNFPANVTGDLNITLDLFPGSGLSGNTSGIMLSGTNTIVITDVKIIIVQSTVKIRASGGTLTPGLSGNYEVIPTPHHMLFVNFPSTGKANFPLSMFRVSFYKSDNSPDMCYRGTVKLTQNTPPDPVFLSGNTIVVANQGSAYFTNLFFTMPGTYTLKATSTGLPDAFSNQIIISQGVPEITSTILPLNMQGNSINSGHTPFVFLAKFSFLYPNTLYKYFNRVVDNTIGTNDPGVGNVIFANSNRIFTRTTNPNFSTPGDYGQFTTDQYGSYTGWFISEATGSSVFTPGNLVQMRISLFDGNGSLLLTTSESVKIRDYYSTPDANKCTYLQQTNTTGSSLVPANMLLFYGSVDTNNNRPVSGTLIESDELTLSGPPYHTQYISNIDGNNQRWGTIIPCDLVSGITMIEERFLTGAKSGNSITQLPGAVKSVAYSSNGIWVPGIDTRNTTGGSTVLSIQPMFVPIGIIKIENQIPNEFKLYQNYPNPFNPVTKIKFQVSSSKIINLNIYDMLGREVNTLVNGRLEPGIYEVTFDGSTLASGVYFYKLLAGDYIAVKRMILIK